MFEKTSLIEGVPELPVGNRVARQRLANGLEVVAAEVPTARRVRLVAVVSVGYLDEPKALPGLAHLLEHALFLGSRGYPRAGDFASWVGEQGGRYNARTDEYVTDYHLSLPPAAAREGLIRLVDLLVRPCLETSAIDREVSVLEAEFQARMMDPALHRQAILSRLFKSAHPAHHFHAGHRTSLGDDAAMLRQQLSAFHDMHYRAERIGLVVLGPLPLDSQFEMLNEVAGEIARGTQPWECRLEKPRWASPAHLQWHPPDNLPLRKPTLELLWPLPAGLVIENQAWLDRLVMVLCDGRLAATLQQQGTISGLVATTQPEGAGAAFSLKLILNEAGTRCVEKLVATCQAAVVDSVARLADRDWPRPPAIQANLDRWPLEQARRLAWTLNNRAEGREEASHLPQVLRETLEACLAPSACRVLEETGDLDGNVHYAPETMTPFHWREPRLKDELAKALLFHAAPLIVTQADYHADRIDRWPDTAQRLDNGESGELWWGGGPMESEASWCLGWPASQAGRDERLVAWRQATLALCQTGRAQGIKLTLGGDAWGDWLMAQGPADRLESVLSQGLAAWPINPAGIRHEAPSGLLAQRLLAHLDAPTATGNHTAAGVNDTVLAWLNGSLNIEQAHAGCLRLQRQVTTRLESIQEPAVQGAQQSLRTEPRVATRWLSPQGDDHALMLQVDGPDDSPASRLTMWLLAHCHDAAFFHELRQRRGLGYVAAVRYREAGKWPRLGYVVQSPHADTAVLQEAVSEFLAERGVALACLDDAMLCCRRDSLRALWGAPETPAEAVSVCWQILREQVLGTSASLAPTDRLPLRPWAAMEDAIDALTKRTVRDYAEALVEGELPRLWWKHAPAGS